MPKKRSLLWILVGCALFQLVAQYRSAWLLTRHIKEHINQEREYAMLPPGEWKTPKVGNNDDDLFNDANTLRSAAQHHGNISFHKVNLTAGEEILLSSVDGPFIRLLALLDGLKEEATNEDPHPDSQANHSTPPPRNREVYFALPRKKKVNRNDTTVEVHTSIQKLKRLLFLIHRWGGPVSVAIYITSAEDVHLLEDFYLKHREGSLYWTDIHVFLEGEDAAAGMGYPHNMLRNMALEGIQDTDYSLALDVDFVTNPPNTYPILKDKMQSDPEFVNQLRNNQTLMVLPAFNREGFFVDESNVLEIGDYLLPKTREEAVKMRELNQVTPFHLERTPFGHGPTKFPHWLRSTSNSTFYPIKFAARFEPYVLGFKAACHNTTTLLPKYWPGFRGFGFNKLTWFVEAHYRGYQFAVLRVFLSSIWTMSTTIESLVRKRFIRFSSFKSTCFKLSISRKNS